MSITKLDEIKEPTAPDIVLLGLILVNLGPLKILQKTNPPISEAAQHTNKMKMIIFV